MTDHALQPLEAQAHLVFPALLHATFCHLTVETLAEGWSKQLRGQECLRGLGSLHIIYNAQSSPSQMRRREERNTQEMLPVGRRSQTAQVYPQASLFNGVL